MATPADFKAHYLKGTLLAVTSDDPLAALAVLRGLRGMADVSLYGDSVHVLTLEHDAASLAALIEAGGGSEGHTMGMGGMDHSMGMGVSP